MAYLIFFISSNLYVSWYANQSFAVDFSECFQCSQFKYITIGTLALALFWAGLLGFLLSNLNVNGSIPSVAPFAVIIPLSILLLNVEQEYTFPFLLNNLKGIKRFLGCGSSSIDPEVQNPNLEIMELNPRNLGPVLGARSRFIDDGGIYTGKGWRYLHR